MSRRLALVLAAGALALSLAPGLVALAQEQPPAAPAPTKADKVTVKHADKLSYDSTAKLFRLTGHVVMVHNDMTLSADKCDYDDKGNTAVASGNLTITDPESTLTGDQVKADFTQKLTQVIGHVTIVTQKKKEEGAAEGTLTEYRQKKTTITCPQIDYFYAEDKKQATVAGPLQAVQEDKTLWADRALYDGLKDQVTLEGNIRILMESGSEFRCPRVVISLKDDSFEAEDLTGVAVEEKKEEPPASAPAPPS